MIFLTLSILLVIILFISFVVALVFLITLCMEKEKKERIMCIKITLISIVVFILSAYANKELNNHFDEMSYTYSEKPYSIEYIVALQDGSEIYGQIRGHYVRGYIGEESYYSYMVKLSNGGMKGNKVPSDNTTIYEADSNFRVEWWVKSKEWLGYKEEVKYWNIYIPKGSVINNYNIDLQ